MSVFSARQDVLLESPGRIEYEMSDVRASFLADDDAAAVDFEIHDAAFGVSPMMFAVIDAETRSELFKFDSMADFLDCFPDGLGDIGPDCELLVR